MRRKRRRFGDSTLFPSPTDRSISALQKIHHKYVKQFDELRADGEHLCRMAAREPNPGAKELMQSLCEDMRRGAPTAQATAQMIQYRARTIYDQRY
jgi:hypothetical protein